MFAAQRGYTLHIVAKQLKNAAVDRLWNRLRERYGVKVIYAKNAARPVLRALRQNDLVGFMLDQHRPRSQGVFVQFFGRPASTSPGLAILSSQAQAPVIPVFIRRKQGGHHVRVLPEIAPPPDREIRAHPAEWVWLHRRWKTQPLPGDSVAMPEFAAPRPA